MSINSLSQQNEVARQNKANSDYRESKAGDSLTHTGTQGRGGSNGNARRAIEAIKDGALLTTNSVDYFNELLKDDM